LNKKLVEVGSSLCSLLLSQPWTFREILLETQTWLFVIDSIYRFVQTITMSCVAMNLQQRTKIFIMIRH